MTDRDLFAAAAMPEILRALLVEDQRRQLAGEPPLTAKKTARAVAIGSYEVADAMLKHRELAPPPDEP